MTIARRCCPPAVFVALALAGCPEGTGPADAAGPDAARDAAAGNDAASAEDAGPSVLIDYPKTGAVSAAGGAFYIPYFPGTTLDRVTLWLAVTVQIGGMTQVIELVAKADAYDGTAIASAIGGASFGAGYELVAIDFDFGNVPVVKGSTVAFVLLYDLSDQTADLVFDNLGDYGGRTGSVIGVVRTAGATPPLDTKVGDGIAIVVYGNP